MVKKYREKNKLLIRRRKVAIRRFWRFFRLFLIGIFFVGMLWGLNYLYNSNYFKIKSIEVEGNSHYQDSAIKEQLTDTVGTNIFEVNVKKAEDNLIENLFWINEVKLSKIFPDEIKITVKERNPYIRIAYGNKLYLADDEGVILEEISKDEQEKYFRLILVRNAVDYYPEPGEKIAKKNALSCGRIYLILDSKIKEDIKEAKLAKNVYGDIIFLTTEEKEIIFGSSNNIVQKCEILKQIMNQLLIEEFEYDTIDLRIVENPTVK